MLITPFNYNLSLNLAGLYNIFVEDGHTNVQVLCPGYKKNDVQIKQVGQILHIEGKTENVKKVKQYKTNFSIGDSFSISFRLESGYVVKTATIKNGIVVVTLEQEKPSYVKIVEVSDD